MTSLKADPVAFDIKTTMVLPNVKKCCLDSPKKRVADFLKKQTTLFLWIFSIIVNLQVRYMPLNLLILWMAQRNDFDLDLQQWNYFWKG